MILIEQIICLGKMSRIIQDGLSGLGGSLLPHGNLVVEILWNWGFDNLRDQISWDSVRLHAHNPIINSKLALSLLDDLV